MSDTINVLVVEDDTYKREHIRRVLREVAQESQLKITEVGDAAKAFSALSDGVFQLLVLDLNIPMREGESPKEDGGVSLLRTLRRRRLLKLPTHIIGLT